MHVGELAVSRWAVPKCGKASTYTVLGFLGYGVASAGAAALFVAWRVPLVDRLIAAFAPPLALLVVVRIARALVGGERIVFYQVAVTGALAAVLLDALIGSQPARVLDVVVCGIGGFLVFGRLGCYAVACCHGRPARFGVVYGRAHVALGFWARWRGRRLWPTQLVESAASAALVIVALVRGWQTPGLPAQIYILGYACVRLGLELVRGDVARPQRLGVSEAQWIAAFTASASAIASPGIASIAIASTLWLALAAIALRHDALVALAHVHELDRTCAAAGSDARAATSLGVAVSRHALPDGRIDWVLSSEHPDWSTARAARLAHLLWARYELVPGRLAGVVHVIEPAA